MGKIENEDMNIELENKSTIELDKNILERSKTESKSSERKASFLSEFRIIDPI